MNTTQQPISAYTLKALVQKLRPSRFPGMSGVMAAIVGFVLGARFCDPSIAEIAVTSDGRVLARAEGEHGANRFIGNYVDLLRNWLSLVAAAGLSQREFIEAQSLFAAKIGFFGPPSA
jgi:hypothetical protein